MILQQSILEERIKSIQQKYKQLDKKNSTFVSKLAALNEQVNQDDEQAALTDSQIPSIPISNKFSHLN